MAISPCLSCPAEGAQSDAVNRAVTGDFAVGEFSTAEADATATLNAMISDNTDAKAIERYLKTAQEIGSWTSIAGLAAAAILGLAAFFFTGGGSLFLVTLPALAGLLITWGTTTSYTAALSEAAYAAVWVNVVIPYVYMNPSVDDAFGPPTPAQFAQFASSTGTPGTFGHPAYAARTAQATNDLLTFYGALKTRVLDDDSTWATTGVDSLVMLDSLANIEEELALVDFFAASEGASDIPIYDSLVSAYAMSGAGRELLAGAMEVCAFVYNEGYREQEMTDHAVNALDTSFIVVSMGAAIRAAVYDSLTANAIPIPPGIGIGLIQGTQTGPAQTDLEFSVVNYGATPADSVIVYPVFAPEDGVIIVGDSADTVDVGPNDTVSVVFSVTLYDSLLTGSAVLTPGLQVPDYYTMPPVQFELEYDNVCGCDCHADPQCDGVTNVLDVVQTVNVAFRSQPAETGAICPNEQTDVDCDGVTNVLDVVKVVNVAFRSADPVAEFCDPCAP